MRKRLFITMLFSAAVMLIGAPAQAGSDIPCTGFLTGPVNGNVVVPEGAACFMTGAQVTGNVKALRNSFLQMEGPNTIGGNVEGDKAQQVWIYGPPNTIHGNGVVVEDSVSTFICGAVLPKGSIHVVKARGFALYVGTVFCFGGGNTVTQGNIKVEDSEVSQLFVSDNRVGQNIQVYKNQATSEVARNNAGESVQCFDNIGTFVGGPNTAPKREGQCF